MTKAAFERMPLKQMRNLLGPKALELYVNSGGMMSTEDIRVRLGVRKRSTIAKWLKFFDADEILRERESSPIAAAELIRKILFDRIKELSENTKDFEPGDADALHKLTHVLRSVKGEVDAKEAWGVFVAEFGDFVHKRHKDDLDFLARFVDDLRAFGQRILREEIREAA